MGVYKSQQDSMMAMLFNDDQAVFVVRGHETIEVLVRCQIASVSSSWYGCEWPFRLA